MIVVGSGLICDSLGEALVVRDLECNLLSPTKLRQQGWTFIQWPNHVDPVHSGVLLDPDGRVALISDCNLKVDISELYSYDDNIVADISRLHASLNNIHVNNIRIARYANKSTRVLVDMVANTFLCSKKDLVDISRTMQTFPVVAAQINKHWQKTKCYSAGISKFRSNQRAVVKEAVRNDPFLQRIEPRNLIIGEQVGTDLKGPVLGMGVYTFVDKASGFVIGKAVKVGKRDKQTSTDNHFIHITSETITMVHNIYRMYKHKLSNLVSDSHSIYKSEQTKDKCIELDIRQEFSAPGQHQFNGLAEITIQQLHALVASMFFLAS